MSKNKKTLLVNGALGRMGQAVIGVCKNRNDIEIKYAVDLPIHKHQEESIYSERDRRKFKLQDIKISKNIKAVDIDLIIDFSTPKSSISLAKKAGILGVPFVTGTTGFNLRQINELKKISKTIPILQSYNMSLGINLLVKIIKENVDYFSSTDLEITETHHRDKIDSPSGTALLLADAVSSSLGKKTDKIANYRGKSSSLKRKKGELGMTVIRGGDVVGEHKISSFGEMENVYLTHQALGREVFANGAVSLGLKLMKKKKGFFSVQDLI
tara:strand:- start:2956 stop:3762 length:807 start_codon:yes stop_codon:yes gene_type:complete